METYREMRQRHQSEIHKFPMEFAYNKEQFGRAMRKLGLQPSDTDKVTSVFAGGIVRNEDVPCLKTMILRHSEELNTAIMSEQDGKGFAYDAFCYELANHEFAYTGDDTDALLSLGLDFNDIAKSRPLMKALSNARRYVCACNE